jgi:hypothetical protein
MSALGSFDQTGSISKAVQGGLLNYGLGQGARYLGGAGFQQGYNPFGGLGEGAYSLGGFQLGASPIGTETGIGKMLSDRAVQQGQLLKAQQKAVMPQDLDSYGSIEEYLQATGQAEKIPFELRTEMIAKDLSTKAAPTDYGQLFKSAVDPKATLGERTEAIKQLGGKAIKDIYTTDEGKVDKLAVAATIAGGASYFDAKDLATEAGLVDDPEQYTEEMYQADKARYLEQYSKALPKSAFGLKDGGRVKYNQGGINIDELPMSREGSPKYYDEEGNEIFFAEFEAGMKEPVMPKRKPEEMVEKNKLDKLMKLKENMEPEAFEMYLEKLKEETGESGVPSIFLKEKRAKGGRIGYSEGSPDDPQGRRKGIVSINPMQEDLEEVGIGTLASSPFTAAEKTFLFKFLAGKGGKERTMTMPDLYKIFKNPGKYPKDEQVLKGVIEMKMGKKYGGRIGYKDAGFITLKDLGITKRTEIEPKFEYNIEDLDIERSIPRVLVMDKNGETKIMDEKLAKTLGLKIIADSFDTEMLREDKKDGGRIGYAGGGRDETPEEKMFREMKNAKVQAAIKLAGEKNIGIGKAMAITNEDDFNLKTGEYEGSDETIKRMLNMKAYGGRIGYMMGSEVPVRENQGGITELDYRNTGGFVPIGIKEKADDVPAMLSKNEFVFTADAVRAAGGGSINNGAQRMYKLMKQLENKVV